MADARAIRFPFQLGVKSVNGKARIQENLSYDDLVRSQVVDALMTNQGERIMRPRYGCDVQSSLFDPEDELVRRDAGALLKRRLEQFVTRAIVRSVTVDIAGRNNADMVFAPSDTMVVITVVYRSALYNTDTTLSIPTSSSFIARQLNPGAQA